MCAIVRVFFFFVFLRAFPAEVSQIVAGRKVCLMWGVAVKSKSNAGFATRNRIGGRKEKKMMYVNDELPLRLNRIPTRASTTAVTIEKRVEGGYPAAASFIVLKHSEGVLASFHDLFLSVVSFLSASNGRGCVHLFTSPCIQPSVY